MIEVIKQYTPQNKFEEKDRQYMLELYEMFKEKLFKRYQFFHFTASGVVFNESFTKVLFIYHKIYDSWGWMGGHLDGSTDFLITAKKEIYEESGLKNITPILPEPISIEVLPVWAHLKNGEVVAAHQHLNVTFSFTAKEEDELKINHFETNGVKWILITELDQFVKEELMLPIYKKIIERVLYEKTNYI